MNLHEQPAQGSFTVYFDDASYMRQLFRMTVASMVPLIAIYLYVHVGHQSFPPLILWLVLIMMGAVLLPYHISHLSSNRDYTNSSKQRKSYLKFDGEGILLFDEIAFPWTAIYSIKHLDAVAGPRRGDGMMSYLILNFTNSTAVDALTPEERSRLMEDDSSLKRMASKKGVPLRWKFVAIAIRGGGPLSSNLSASDVLIESMVRRYFTSAQDEHDLQSSRSQ